MARSVTGALMGDPGHGPSPSARAYEPNLRPWRRAPPPEPYEVRSGSDFEETLPGSIDAPREDPELNAKAELRQVLGPGSELRPVAPLKASVGPGQPATEPPVFMDVRPTELLIDGSYQRDLSDRGLRLIARIVEGWDWRRFKPPVCAWTSSGLVIIDGQHTAIAAATHGKLDTIPVMIVEARETRDQASAFVGHNKDRLALHPTQIHAGAVAAGDAEALKVEYITQAAGVRIARNPYGSKRYEQGDTIAVGTITKLISDRGDATAIACLHALAQGCAGLITKDQIRAAEELLTNTDFSADFDWADLPAAIRKAGEDGEREARRYAADHAVPFWRGLVHVWFRAVKKRRKA